MKAIKIIALATILLTGAVSCSKNYSDDYNNSGGASGQTTAAVITQGSWKISYISNEGLDITSTLSGYSFMFSANAGVSATNNAGVSTLGTWSTVATQNENQLMVNFSSSQAPLNALKDNWNVFLTSSTQVKMQLERASGRVDYFTIDKIQ